MFAGTFSLLAPTSSGTFGTWSGSGSGSVVSTSGGGWSFNSGDSGGGSYSYTAASYPAGYSYNYQASTNPYVYPGAGLRAGPFGEHGPYTPIDFPLMRELTPGERLENLNTASGFAQDSVLPYLALGVIVALLVKR